MPLADIASSDERDACEDRIESWAARRMAEDGPLVAVDRQSAGRRWYLRLAGEEKQFITCGCRCASGPSATRRR